MTIENTMSKIERMFPHNKTEKGGCLVYIKHNQIKSLDMALELLVKFVELYENLSCNNIMDEIREDLNNVYGISQNYYCQKGLIKKG